MNAEFRMQTKKKDVVGNGFKPFLTIFLNFLPPLCGTKTT